MVSEPTCRIDLKAVVHPSGPVSRRVFAIGDVHGRADLLATLLASIEQEIEKSTLKCLVVVLGDMIDRGVSSRETIEIIADFSHRHETVCLCGNHEWMMLRFLEDPACYKRWVSAGGLHTLASYGVAPAMLRSIKETFEAVRDEFVGRMGEKQYAWFARLPLFFVLEEFLFVHAGVRPNISLNRQDASDFLWIGGLFLEWRHPFQKYVVHGHTPIVQVEVKANRANVDTGAFATKKLSCLDINGSRWSVIST